MATGSISPSKDLREDDLGTLCEVLHPVNNKYKFLGLQIGVKKSEIDEIEAQYKNPGERMLEILSVRVKKTETITWNDIDAALRSHSVGEGKVADEIRKTYFSHLDEGRLDQEQDAKSKNGNGRKGNDAEDNSSLRPNDKQDLDKEASVTVQSKKSKEDPEKPKSNKAEKVSQKTELFPQRSTPKETRRKKDRSKKEYMLLYEQSQQVPHQHQANLQKETWKTTKVKLLRDHDHSEMASDDEYYESDTKYASHKSKRFIKEVKKESDSVSSSEEENMTSSPIESCTKRKRNQSNRYAHKKSQSTEYKEQKLSYRGKEKNPHKQNYNMHQRGATPASGVKEKPTHQLISSLKEVRSESEPEDESSSVSSSEEEVSDIPSHEFPTSKTSKHSIRHTKPKHRRMMHLYKDVKSVKLSKKKSSLVPFPTKAAIIHSEQGTAALSMNNEKLDLYDSEKGKEDKHSQRQTQSKREDTTEPEPEDESSTSTSEEETKKKTKKYKNAAAYIDDKRRTEKRRKEEREKKIQVAAVDLPVDDERSDPCGRSKGQDEREIQLRQDEIRMVGNSSSPSNSQEEYKKQPGPREKRRRRKLGSDHKTKENSERRKIEKESLQNHSGTDDSSPECDMLKQNKVEMKKLRKVFECFFGILCSTIVNPVGIAAQLQKKRLISKSVMKDMMMSPESQQSKIISLVDKLEKKIKLKPYFLFVFIRVLLENEALQGTGREMLREAGKYSLCF